VNGEDAARGTAPPTYAPTSVVKVDGVIYKVKVYVSVLSQDLELLKEQSTQNK
jgi:hypothetical protein